MVIYKNTLSDDRPLDIEFTETRVFVAKNIHQIELDFGEEKRMEYEFDYIEYTYEEYEQLSSQEIPEEEE